MSAGFSNKTFQENDFKFDFRIVFLHSFSKFSLYILFAEILKIGWCKLACPKIVIYNLTFFVKGGRVSKVSGWFGTALKICPLLNVSNEGKLIPRFKVRGKNNVSRRAFEKMKELADHGIGYADKCYISNSACYEDARILADMIEASFPNLKGRVEIYSVGTTIGSHTGPGTVALFFWGQKRVD